VSQSGQIVGVEVPLFAQTTGIMQILWWMGGSPSSRGNSRTLSEYSIGKSGGAGIEPRINGAIRYEIGRASGRELQKLFLATLDKQKVRRWTSPDVSGCARQADR